MYCFPYPHASDITPIRVPYTECVPYSIGGPFPFNKFYIFALTIELIRRASCADGLGLDPEYSSTALNPVIQSWLFFGLASEALGRNVEHSEFLESCAEESTRRWVDLRLPRWFWSELKTRWDNPSHNLPALEHELARKQLVRCLGLALTVVTYFDIEKDGKGHDPELSLILLSIHMLLYLIARVLGEVEIARTSLQCKSTQVLIRRMLDNGWCRKRLNHIEVVHLYYPALFFMSSFRPPRARGENHQSCDANKCSVRRGLSPPLHRTIDCQCRNVGIPLEQIAKIIADGGVPVIRIQTSPNDEIKFEVVPCERKMLFTAVSHVWADRQLGSAENALPECQVRYLDTVLASLPRQVQHWRMCDWVPKRFLTPTHADAIFPPSRTYELFWMDTFCIPQAPEHAYLKSKAIESMNLIYATAAQTLVFDAGLQDFDAGQRPSSQSHGGSHTFYGPTNAQLLETLAHICASNWMGRAWTLQEGVLSHHLVFSLKGSLAYLRLLWPNYDDGLTLADLDQLPFFRKFQRITRGFLGYSDQWEPPKSPLTSTKDDTEPLRDCIRAELFEFLKSSLNVDGYSDYARGPTDRATRFVKFHGLLQSRSTTQPEDIPLLLMNMSGMNGNAVTQEKSTESRIQLLFYGLDSVPMEFLLCDCARVLGCKADSWIPTEIIPERFDGDFTLQLTSEGWKPKHKTGLGKPKFCLSSPSVIWDKETILSLPKEGEDERVLYHASVANTFQRRPAGDKHHGWCVLIDDTGLVPRGALFTVSRIDGVKRFLEFEGTLNLQSYSEPTEKPASAIHIGLTSDPRIEYIIERSSTPQTLGMSRPQNPEQYSDRLIVISQVIYSGLCELERRILKRVLGDFAENTYFIIFYTLLSLKKPRWVEDKVQAFVHYAWVKTFQTDLNAQQGRWKWFWILSNWEPPIPFKTMMKHWCRLLFFLYFNLGVYSGVLQVSMYWLIPFPKEELLNMYVIAALTKVMLWYFF